MNNSSWNTEVQQDRRWVSRLPTKESSVHPQAGPASPSSHTACLELQYDDYGQSFRNPLGTHADNESQDKRITGDCGGCKRFRIQAHQSPPPGNLPSTRNQGITPFEVPSVDFAGPAIPYRTKGKAARKVYLALYTWSLKRVPYHPKIQYLW